MTKDWNEFLRWNQLNFFYTDEYNDFNATLLNE